MNLNQKQNLNFPPVQPSFSNNKMVKATEESTSERKEGDANKTLLVPLRWVQKIIN